MPLRIWQISFASLFLVASAYGQPAPDSAGAEFFESKVRPVFVEHCYKCHSGEAASAGKLKGELRLDSHDELLKGGKTGPEIVPGHPEKSRLIEAIRYGNEDLQMPPKDRLPAAVVADLEKWVAMGAVGPRLAGPAGKGGTAAVARRSIDIEAGKQFWSFQPIHHVAPPAVAPIGALRCATPIDQFVWKLLEQKGLRPNPIAGREKLIRRATFDLTGLPPTPAETAAFVNDPAPDAYDKLLDRLLASPRYGERWARHWLDVARFAESDGYEHDSDRPAAYQYRDFIIRALNEDMPFDQFVQWQIAGDELAPNDWHAMAATGFLSAGVFPTQITEKEFEFTRYNQLDDMVSTTGNAMLGLTVGCARCHDHKFDPIPTTDYYRMAAAFTTAIRSDVEIDITTAPEREKFHADWLAKIAEVRKQIDAIDKDEIQKKLDETIAKVKADPEALAGEWSVINFDTIKPSGKAKYVAQADGSLLLEGKAPKQEKLVLSGKSPAEKIAAIRLEALADKSLPHNGPGAGANGNFALTEIDIQAGSPGKGAKRISAKISRAIVTHEQNHGDLSVASAFDGDSKTGWAVDNGGIGKSQAAIFYLQSPLEIPADTALTITLHFDHASPEHLIGRPRISVSADASAKEFTGHEGAPPAIADIFRKLAAGDEVPADSRERARAWIAKSVEKYQKLLGEVAKLEADGPAKNITKVQVTSEGVKPVENYADGRGYPHFYKDVYQLRRGDPNNKVQVVSESFPQVLMRGGKDETYWQTPPPADAKTSGRRTALARWLTDTDHGAGNLAARVIVNRLWQHHFGKGIVATPNDFGAQGERPSNPELLEYLADDLVSHGWQLKRLHKLMMTSATYMQDSTATPDRVAIDPHDDYLWRWQPRRLEAEPIRDAMLAVAGSLDETMYGRGTLDQSSHRRSIYFTVKRSQLIPMMMVLDWPEALNSIGVRPVTTVAPQALLFMNSPQARQYAEGFARRVHSESVPDSIEQAYRIALARAPEKSEVELGAAFIAQQQKRYEEAKRPDAKGEAMVDFCQAMMSANEFVYVD